MKRRPNLTKTHDNHSRAVQGCSAIRRVLQRIILALALGAATLAQPGSAQGQWGNSFTADQARDAREKGEIKPLNDLLQPIRQQYGGNMRRFDGLYERGGKKVYIIDWVTGRGELVTFTIDARSGRVISKS